ncbi:hypothetical protein KC340_g13157 [Hortaea werneckii]|nr:hypothetical protein KC342_g18282 [Hortaea werneckii]KAI7070754.1 hypothetical protein KC339_g14555 [Hortaea werneckii]KAI7216542.1 hypothetical protein KC365_g13230 [Hortaea werneckii]KAI7301044.1 hypothetical protein KC340_g13157 [Hortaea werneckii]KAI7375029.1 hypothetical protein KC328_g15683 [Hortaea werneckii]
MQAYLLFLGLSAIASAQLIDDDNFNPTMDIASCAALPCQNGTEKSNICHPMQTYAGFAYGVGMVPDALALPGANFNLSYTLVDGEGWGTFADQPYYDFSPLGLFVGAPADANLTNEAPVCSLLFQYQGQTFSDSSPDVENTTACPQLFTGIPGDYDCFDELRETIRAFDFSTDGNDSSYSSRTRCEALAQYVEFTAQQLGSDSNRVNTVCSYFANLVSVTGGAISGPEVSTDTARPAGNDSSCQPVLPQDYNLHQVAYAREVLYENPLAENQPYLGPGGRSGYTPVVSVVYGDGDDTDPEVSLLCMRTYDPSGGELPLSTPGYDNGGTRIRIGVNLAVVLSSVLILAFLY